MFISAVQVKTETDAPCYDIVLELCEVTNHLWAAGALSLSSVFLEAC